MTGLAFLMGGVLGYGMAWLIYSDEVRFWKERSDYWYGNSTDWMRYWFRDHDAAAPRPTTEDDNG